MSREIWKRPTPAARRSPPAHHTARTPPNRTSAPPPGGSGTRPRPICAHTSSRRPASSPVSTTPSAEATWGASATRAPEAGTPPTPAASRAGPLDPWPSSERPALPSWSSDIPIGNVRQRPRSLHERPSPLRHREPAPTASRMKNPPIQAVPLLSRATRPLPVVAADPADQATEHPIRPPPSEDHGPAA